MTFTAKKFATAVALSVLASSPFLASAASNGYKMVLIENTPGVTTIQAGQLQQGISEVTNYRGADADNFSLQMSLCVAYSRLNQIDLAQSACSKAVSLAQTTPALPTDAKREMRALAYSNRGVMHVLANDRVAALEDFKRAVSLQTNEINQHNLARLTADINGVDANQIAYNSAE
jgi:Flp pilus assembly protein TadD